VPFTLFVTDDTYRQWRAPCLLVTGDEQQLPPHPDGKTWRWALTSSEDPRGVLVGRMLISVLKRRGWVISELPVEQLLRRRAVAPDREPVPLLPPAERDKAQSRSTHEG
jgi:hypothetical protein